MNVRETYTGNVQYKTLKQNGLQQFSYFGIVGLVDLGFSTHVFVVTAQRVINNTQICSPTAVKAIWLYRSPLPLSLDQEEHEHLTLKAFADELTAGDKYYSLNEDLTSGPQSTHGTLGPAALDPSQYFHHITPRFFWNEHLLSSFLEMESYNYILPLICGYVGSAVIQLDGPPVQMILISRINKCYPATRYWRRGISPSGHTAIETETDVMCLKEDLIASFTLQRGSVPLFWTQTEITDPIRNPKIDISRALMPESINAMKLHFQMLLGTYGQHVDIIDMIDRKKANFKDLSSAYEKAVRYWDHPNIRYFKRDPITDSKSLSVIMGDVPNLVTTQEFFVANREKGNTTTVLNTQKGIIRINSIDCVDDTTTAQYYIALYTLQKMLQRFNIWMPSRTKLERSSLARVRSLWVQNGDALSNYYTGTCMENHYRINGSIYSMLTSPFYRRYIIWSRTYLSHFADYKRQDTRDLFMGNLVLSMHPAASKSKDGVVNQQLKILATVDDQIYLRQRLVLHENKQNLLTAIFLIVRRFTSPLSIKTPIQFVCAMIWLIVYTICARVFRIDMKLMTRKPKDLMDIQELPDISNLPPHGIEANLERWRQKGIDAMTKTAVVIHFNVGGSPPKRLWATAFGAVFEWRRSCL